MAHNVSGQLRPINWALGPAFRVNPHYKSWYFSHILCGERFQPIPARNCCSVAFSGDNSDWATAITRAPYYKQYRHLVHLSSKARLKSSENHSDLPRHWDAG
jgi:hypothetical protein